MYLAVGAESADQFRGMNRAFSANAVHRYCPGATPQASIDAPPSVLVTRRIRSVVILAVLAILVAALIGAMYAQRPPPRISDDRDLKEIDLTGWDCLNKPGGSAKTPDGVERNTLKNRSATDISNLKLPDLDVVGFIKSLGQFDALTVHVRRKDLGPAERQQLDPLEKEIVQVTGYLGVAYCGPPETTNCASVDFHDWHLEMFEKPIDHPPAIGDTTPIICEITPRTQNAIYADKVRIQELTAFFRRADLTYESTGHPARRIRIIGYRLWDDEHNGSADVGTTVKRMNPNKYHNPWRQTAWEIHQYFQHSSPGDAVVNEVATGDAFFKYRHLDEVWLQTQLKMMWLQRWYNKALKFLPGIMPQMKNMKVFCIMP
jgi:hypothetical protein